MEQKSKHVEVSIASENGKAYIQGKTNVPFKVFVGLVLQRKVQSLFKQWQDEPVVVSSELLTSLASAPEDSQEDRGNLVLVTLLAGVFLGVFITLVGLFVLMLMRMAPSSRELLIIIGIFIIAGLILMLAQRTQRSNTKQKIHDKMERLTDLFSK